MPPRCGSCWVALALLLLVPGSLPGFPLLQAAKPKLNTATATAAARRVFFPDVPRLGMFNLAALNSDMRTPR